MCTLELISAENGHLELISAKNDHLDLYLHLSRPRLQKSYGSRFIIIKAERVHKHKTQYTTLEFKRNMKDTRLNTLDIRHYFHHASLLTPVAYSK